MNKIGGKFFSPEWFDLDRGNLMRQYVKIRFYAPKLFMIEQEDGSLVEEIEHIKSEITFPDRGDIAGTKKMFLAAYPEATIIDISSINLTD